MILKQDILNKIKDYFDLNIYETKVWLALLGKGIASAGEIADISKVPRSRTYDVLESLEKKGFAIVKLGKPVKYIGVKPHVVLEKLKRNVHEHAVERIEDLSKIKTTEEFSALESLYTEGINPIKREDVTAAITGRSNITNYLKDILENATKEVIFCLNAEDFKQKEKIFNQTIELLEKNGIKIKIALSGDEKLIKDISTRLNIKPKKIDINAKFFIVDRKEILFYLINNSQNQETAIWLNSEFFAQAFAGLFDNALKNQGGNN